MKRDLITIAKEFRHFHFCCGLGGGKQGFNAAQPQVGNMAATLRCIGGIDNDPAAIRDFDRAGPGRPGTVMDLFTRAQYTAFHGKEPPSGWREATAVDIRRAAGNESPNIVFISSPCKGASGLLSETLSKTAKYQALNELTLRCIWLMCEAWADNPVDLIVFENVPRLATRGRHLLDQINQLLQQFGYAVAETTHDCGELGGLAQSRKRFLLVARHMEKVPPFLYEPERKRLRAVGDVLGRMPFPGDAAGGPMHRIPRLQWKTWVRLAFVEAGSDWRSLNKLAVENGHLSDYLIVPDMHNGVLGVRDWGVPTGTVTGNSRPATGSFSVADPRHFGPDKHSNECRINPWTDPAKVVSSAHSTGQCVADPRYINDGDYGQLGVRQWDKPTGTITGQRSPIQGGFSVADPRPPSGPIFSKYAVTPWDKRTGTVIGGDDQGAYAVADPRSSTGFEGAGKYLVTPFDEAAGTVIAGSTTGQGAFCVADPRAINRQKGDAFLTGGHYGVLPWDGQSGAVSASAGYDNGRWSIADPRIDEAPQLPALNQKTVALIRALDGTWHRPFTTLELGALQSLIDPDEHWSTDPKIQREIDEHKRRTGASAFPLLDGTNDSAHRERIGNAVPKLAAQAIGEVMGTTLLLAAAGETFVLSAMPIWVQPVAIAIAASQAGAGGEL
ncbi:DNA cytosine methyltransferase [Janthinobacterium agaricidamnosum]|uniref:DNA cytosine methyltransferase n=1 Tax=Janthinobacterium agaricidamnosum TaxID=55508 RepID=A0A3G2EAR8_9BURK|nr:DNA cytosine methyltransferase [Janthinobacterium agaricidamnosum]AYM76930.1 DNA cytosine methyltransferase [Janthinobacterium agaricidamnosum]